MLSAKLSVEVADSAVSCSMTRAAWSARSSRSCSWESWGPGWSAASPAASGTPPSRASSCARRGRGAAGLHAGGRDGAGDGVDRGHGVPLGSGEDIDAAERRDEGDGWCAVWCGGDDGRVRPRGRIPVGGGVAASLPPPALAASRFAVRRVPVRRAAAVRRRLRIRRARGRRPMVDSIREACGAAAARSRRRSASTARSCLAAEIVRGVQLDVDGPHRRCARARSPARGSPATRSA